MMGKINSSRKIIISLACLLSATVSHGQSADKWFNSMVWLNGLRLKPHASVDKQRFTKEYQAHKADWDKAFAFLKDSNLATIKPGKYLIDGEQVYATVTEGPEKELDSTKWEAHKIYQDIHYIIRGKEKIGIASPDKLHIQTPYNASRDVTFYTGEGKYYTAEPGSFLICFPSDAHRPSIKVDGYETVKKIVLKIRTSD